MATSEADLHDAFEKAARTRKRGRLKPVHIFSPERRKIDEDTVAKLDAMLHATAASFTRSQSAPKARASTAS
jgi:hypothetical protein